MNQWISVKDRLPEIGEYVIAYGKKGGVFICKRECEFIAEGKIYGSTVYRGFIYWMPLPEPPVDKNE